MTREMVEDLSKSALGASFQAHQAFQALLRVLICLFTLREA